MQGSISWGTKIAIGFLVALAAVSFFLFWLLVALPSKRVPSTSPEETLNATALFSRNQSKAAIDAHNQLKSENTTYAEANRLRLAGNFADAANQYRAALTKIDDPAQAAETRFWLAYSEAASGNYVEAVQTYKEIVEASTTLSKLTRAYAVETLAHMYYRYGNPAITREIFKDEPYKSLQVANNIPLSYRNLFDYATELYPLGMSELYSANWYANRLIVTPAEHPEYKDIIREKLRLAESYLNVTRDDRLQRYTYLYTLEQRAMLFGYMKRIGDMSFGDPELAFKELLGLFATNNLQSSDGTTRLQYAYYLTHMYGKARAPDIHDILAPIESNPAAHGVVIVVLLKDARTYNRTVVKANLVLLASLDPEFKKLLISLGWTEADFQ